MKYSKAPIREAIFEIQVAELEISSVDEILNFKSKLSDEFVAVKHGYGISGSLEVGKDGQFIDPITSELVGYGFATEDNKRVVQITKESFSLNILAPYNSWEEHFEQFLLIWRVFIDTYKPTQISRIATRYVNKIDAPLPCELSNYLTHSPTIPDIFPQELQRFVTQVTFPSGDGLSQARVSQNFELHKGYISIILDIDVFQNSNIELSEDLLTRRFEGLREVKNLVFESFVTDQAKKTFI